MTDKIDISPEAVGAALRALFMSPKGVDEFVTVQEITYALSARVAELEALLDVSDDFTVAYIVGQKDGDDRAKAAEARVAELTEALLRHLPQK